MEKEKIKKPFYKKWWFWVIIVVLVIGIFGNRGGNSEKVKDTATQQSPSESHIYDHAEIIDLMSGSGNNKIGTVSVSRAEQADCTDEAITDWFFNYVQEHTDCNYHIVVYTDNPTKGIYSLGSSFIQKDIALIEDADGSYSTGNDAGSTYYDVDLDNKAIKFRFKMIDEETINDLKTKIDSIIPEEYKAGNNYAVDIAGEDGGLVDCNLTLINESFADANYQSIAEDLATKIKELNLNIGYFNISFQSDDYTLEALSGLDDLSSQDVSEISTSIF